MNINVTTVIKISKSWFFQGKTKILPVLTAKIKMWQKRWAHQVLWGTASVSVQQVHPRGFHEPANFFLQVEEQILKSIFQYKFKTPTPSFFSMFFWYRIFSEMWVRTQMFWFYIMNPANVFIYFGTFLNHRHLITSSPVLGFIQIS